VVIGGSNGLGVASVDMIVNEDFGRMVGIKQNEIISTPLKMVLDKLHLVDVEKLYNTKNYKSLDLVG